MKCDTTNGYQMANYTETFRYSEPKLKQQIDKFIVQKIFLPKIFISINDYSDIPLLSTGFF